MDEDVQECEGLGGLRSAGLVGISFRDRLDDATMACNDSIRSVH